MRTVSLSLAAVLLAGVSATAATPAVAAPSDRPWLGYTIGLQPNVKPLELLKRLDIQPSGALEWVTGLNAVSGGLFYEGHYSSVLTKLQADPDVRFAELMAFTDSNESYWNPLTGRELDTVQLPHGKTGTEDVTVAVLNTGVTPNRDLPESRLVPGFNTLDLPFVGHEDLPRQGRSTKDDGGFGTMTAGIIAGDSGICPSCKIMPVKVSFADPGRVTGSASDLAAGIVWATDHGADVITTPAVVDRESKLLAEAIQYALNEKVLVVASAGKDIYDGRQVQPAATEQVLSVSAVDTSGRVTGRYGSNTGGSRWIDVAAAEGAPAVNHLGASSQLDGVEGATAVVAGTAALAFSMQPGVKADEVRQSIVDTAIPAGLPVLNAGRAVHKVAGNDTADPEITSTGLTANQLISKPIDVRPVATDDYGIVLTELTAGGKTVTTRSPWETLRFTPPAGFSGDLAVSLRVTDVAGKTAGATTVVKVDTVGPTGSFVSPAAGARVRGAAKVVFRGSADVASAKVNGVAMKKSGADWTASATPNRGNLVVEAADQYGNVSRFTRAVVVDNDGPTATAVNPKQNTRVRGTFTTSLSGVKDASGVAKAELWANGKYLGAGYSKKVATGKSSGNVKLVWKLTDKLGNSRSYTRIVIADNKAPSVSITKAPKNKAKVKGTVKVSVKASDASGIARVELIVNGKVVATDKTSGYVLSVNTKKQKKSMQVRVRAYDKLGNVTYTTTRTWYRK
ncbi:S8 family serine peptidase [Actinoplanes missouriensis]|uniref:S8 family serine peptidase n=1 Tax=Actinoplanes missouriensis TaxID=1866 RepID=UPI00155DD0FB|nr:S8 family serine peptidase [Actinoplanes missouriensis]